MKNKLFIVDDHKMLLLGLQYYLNTNTFWDVTDVFDSKKECLKKLAELTNENLPEIIIVDVQLAEENGFSLVQEISEKYQSIKCVMYSMYNTAGYIMQAKNCGAKGDISKVAKEKELVECLKIVQAGGVYVEEKLCNIQENLDTIEPLLAKREKRILEKILQNKSNKEISDELFLSIRTVEDYVSDIYDKCNVKNRTELVNKFK